MKHFLFRAIVLISFPLILSAPVTVFSQENMTFIGNAVFENPKMSAARFEHDVHNATADITNCAVCHHVYENGRILEEESSQDQACSECHRMEAGGRQPGLRQAFHRNCRCCHLDRKSGPILCGQCHAQKALHE